MNVILKLFLVLHVRSPKAAYVNYIRLDLINETVILDWDVNFNDE